MLGAASQATHGRQQPLQAVSGTIPSASGSTPELSGGKVLAHSPRASSEISIRSAAQYQAEYGRADHICTLMASRFRQLISSNRMLVFSILCHTGAPTFQKQPGIFCT